MAEIRKQCRAVVSDKVGRLAEVTSQIKQAGVNILALSAWVEEGQGHIMVVAAEAEKCCQALSKVVDKCEWDEVVCVEVKNEVGALDTIAGKLAEANIQVNKVFATCAQGGQAMIVLKTSDNAKATQIL